MAFKAICVILVIVVLLEDGSSMREKTEKEKKEDRELAEKVNATLIEEEKKKTEEEKKNEKKGKEKEDGSTRNKEKEVDQDEACSQNFTCPTVDPCPEEKVCPDCPPEKECPKVKECGPCPTIKPCKPCDPCPVANITAQPPSISGCPEVPEMSLPVAMAIGAIAGVLFTGVATIIGLLLRYTSPIESGFVFLATVIVVWYLCSHYPETAREIGGRAATLLREAATALSHRVMVAIRHREQVGFPILILVFLRLSSMFSIEKFALRFSM
jgi:hypothetical protein